ncbi:hypothetical protein J6590_003721 [Homalodisca vitripennis]|nr:hypothetical protein J6590_003721 [Homalodisca vitripennis]
MLDCTSPTITGTSQVFHMFECSSLAITTRESSHVDHTRLAAAAQIVHIAAFDHFVRVHATERRRAERLLSGGSLGRSFSRSHGPLPPPPLPLPNVPPPMLEPSVADKRRASLRGSLSRAFGLKPRSGAKDDLDSGLQTSPPSTPSETSSMVSCRPDSPQSLVAIRRRPHHRHRRVKSIGDIDSLTVTPV